MRLVLAIVLWLGSVCGVPAQDGILRVETFTTGEWFFTPTVNFFERMKLGCNLTEEDMRQAQACKATVETLHKRSTLLLNDLRYADNMSFKGKAAISKRSQTQNKKEERKLRLLVDKFLTKHPEVRFFVLDIGGRRA